MESHALFSGHLHGVSEFSTTWSPDVTIPTTQYDYMTGDGLDHIHLSKADDGSPKDSMLDNIGDYIAGILVGNGAAALMVVAGILIVHS